LEGCAGWVGFAARAWGGLAVPGQALEGLGEWMQMLLWGDEDEVDEGLLGEQNGGVS